MEIKVISMVLVGGIGGVLSYLFGSWDIVFKTFLIFLVVDYLSGLVVAGVFHKSKKTETGALSSSVGWRGICKKGMMLAIILVAHQMDLVRNTTYIRDGVIMAFSFNELISMIENASLMGIPIPNILEKTIDIYRKTIDDIGKKGG